MTAADLLQLHQGFPGRIDDVCASQRRRWGMTICAVSGRSWT
jgi:hypothetical protein